MTVEPAARRGGRAHRDGAGAEVAVARESGPWCRRRRSPRTTGRPVVKASPWENDIPAYFFLGGLAAGSSLLAAGADLRGLPKLRRSARIAALVGGCGRKRRADSRPGTAGAIPQHAAHRKADVADVDGHMGARRVRAGSLARRCCGDRRDAALPSSDRRPPPRDRSAACRSVRGRARACTRVVHGRAALGHRHSGVASARARELPFVFVASAAASAGGLAMIATA